MASAEFTVTVETRVLEDLAARLRNTRWPQDLDNDDWFYGTNLEYLRELVDYWINHSVSGQSGRMTGSTPSEITGIEVNGIPIHFIREERARTESDPLDIDAWMAHGNLLGLQLYHPPISGSRSLWGRPGRCI